MRCGLAGALALLFCPAAVPAAAEPARTCPGEVASDVLRDTTPDGELILGSGARVTLVDLRLAPGFESLEKRGSLPPHAEVAGKAGPRSTQDGGASFEAPQRGAPQDEGRGGSRPGSEAAALLRSFGGSRVTVRTVGPEDRWARRAAEVGVAGPAEAMDLAELLVGEGFALVDPGPRDALCRPELLAIEGAARRAGRGYWRRAGVLRAGDPEALKAAAGSFALVEGRIASVGERRDRTYLNFGTDFSRDFSVVIPRRSWAAFKLGGRDAASLRGRRVRVRGQLELGRAPSMEVNVPDVVELLPDDARRNRTEPNL